MSAIPTSLRDTLTDRVVAITGRRVRELDISLADGAVTLTGRADSFYTKQLAQHGVKELLPAAKLKNAILVD